MVKTETITTKRINAIIFNLDDGLSKYDLRSILAHKKIIEKVDSVIFEDLNNMNPVHFRWIKYKLNQLEDELNLSSNEIRATNNFYNIFIKIVEIMLACQEELSYQETVKYTFYYISLKLKYRL